MVSRNHLESVLNFFCISMVLDCEVRLRSLSRPCEKSWKKQRKGRRNLREVKEEEEKGRENKLVTEKSRNFSWAKIIRMVSNNLMLHET